jgi:hypothetical protein
MLHRPASKKKRAIILTDALEEGQDSVDYESRKEGGRGKSIFSQILSEVISLENFSTGEVVKKVGGKMSKDEVGKSLTTAYAGLGIMFCDELTSHEVLASYFEAITGKMPVRRMRTDINYIEALEKPRLVFCTNALYLEEGRSYDRRYYEYELPAIFGGKKGLDPEVLYGRAFFSDDWTQKDWECFMAFMVYCVQTYLRIGLVAQQHNREEKKQAVYAKPASLEMFEHYLNTSWDCQTWRESTTSELVISGTMNFMSHITANKLPGNIISQNTARKYFESFMAHYQINWKANGKRGWKITDSYMEVRRKIQEKDSVTEKFPKDITLPPTSDPTIKKGELPDTENDFLSQIDSW